MRNPNGYGSIVKMSGNRRRPWRVRVTAGWEIDEVTEKAKQISKTLGYYATKKDAMQALAEYNVNPYDLTNRNITFAEAFSAWTPKHFEKYPKTAATLRTAYSRCEPLYEMKMIDIRTKHMQDIMDTVADKSTSTQAQLKSAFAHTFKYCLENDIVMKDYSKFVTVTQTPIKQDIKNKFFTTEELKKVFANKDYVVSFPTGKRTYANLQLVDSVIILLYTGLRITELLELKSEHVDLEERILNVHGTKTDAADRKVPIHKDLVPYIEKRLAEKNEFLLSNANGKPFNSGAYRKYFFEPFMQLIGAGHTPHATRHTFISIMDNCGVSSESVVLKRIVGHSNTSMTQHYTHKEVKALIAAMDKYKIEL